MNKYNEKLNCWNCPKRQINWDTMELICELTNEVVSMKSVCESHPHWESFIGGGMNDCS